MTCYNIDKSVGHFIKWNMLFIWKQILYSTYIQSWIIENILFIQAEYIENIQLNF